MTKMNPILENLLTKKGAQIITIEALVPKVAKKKKYFKKSVVNGVINWNYQNSVNRQKERENKEGDFKAEPRKWGERILGTPLVRHKNKLYLEIKVQRALSTEYQDENGNQIEKPEPQTKQQHSRQGLEREVILRDYLLENIKSITIGGQTIRLDDVAKK